MEACLTTRGCSAVSAHAWPTLRAALGRCHLQGVPRVRRRVRQRQSNARDGADARACTLAEIAMRF